MRDGKVDLVDKCLKCGKLTDNDTGEIVREKDIEKDAYINYWICGDCSK